LNVQNNKQL